VDGGPDYVSAIHFQRQKRFLYARGYRLLAKLKVKTYHVLLFGSKEFKF
jgi:hypothetical protein